MMARPCRAGRSGAASRQARSRCSIIAWSTLALVLTSIPAGVHGQSNAANTTQSGSLAGGARVWDHGVRGSNQVIAIMDVGVDLAHCAVSGVGKVVTPTLGVTPQGDEASAGLILAASAAGVLPGGSLGAAPDATMVVFDAATGAAGAAQTLDLDMFRPLDQLDSAGFFQPVYDQGARISASTLDDGAGTPTAYSALEREVDSFAHQHRDFLPVFSGTSVSSLNVAKNALLAGASLLETSHEVGICTEFPALTTHCSNVGSNPSFFDVDVVADASVTGPGYNNRIKPDVLMPQGTFVRVPEDTITASPALCDAQADQSPGIAAGSAAGAAALVRDYLVQGMYPTGAPVPGDAISNPPASLIKAMLINSAQLLSRKQDGAGVASAMSAASMFNPDQGFGRVQLDQVLFFADDMSRTSFLWFNGGSDAAVVTHGKTVEVCRPVEAGQALHVTLTWTDPPSASNAADALVHDLDLVVVDPSMAEHLGNANAFGISAPDRINTVEKVIIDAPTAGEYCFRVTGADVAPGQRQDFALVVSGAGACLPSCACGAELGQACGLHAESDLCQSNNVCTASGCSTNGVESCSIPQPIKLEPSFAILQPTSGAATIQQQQVLITGLDFRTDTFAYPRCRSSTFASDQGVPAISSTRDSATGASSMTCFLRAPGQSGSVPVMVTNDAETWVFAGEFFWSDDLDRQQRNSFLFAGALVVGLIVLMTCMFQVCTLYISFRGKRAARRIKQDPYDAWVLEREKQQQARADAAGFGPATDVEFKERWSVASTASTAMGKADLPDPEAELGVRLAMSSKSASQGHRIGDSSDDGDDDDRAGGGGDAEMLGVRQYDSLQHAKEARSSDKRSHKQRHSSGGRRERKASSKGKRERKSSKGKRERKSSKGKDGRDRRLHKKTG